MFGFFRIKTFEKKQKQSKRPKKILVTLPNFASVALFPMPLNYEHCVIANGTEVYCCGRNSFGQLGTGDCKDRIVIEKIELHIRIICVSAAYHTMAVTEDTPKDGSLWGWGCNIEGQIGLGTLASVNQPTKVLATQNFISVSCGAVHSLALTDKGQVWSFGANKEGQLGLGDTTPRYVPCLVPNLPPCKMISTRNVQSLALDFDGYLWFFGKRRHSKHIRPTNNPTPSRLPELSRIQDISSGYYFSLALDLSGHVWAFGDNNFGQLGLGHRDTTGYTVHKVPGLENIVRVKCGGNSSYFQDNQGRVFVCGSNEHAQLGFTSCRLPVESPREMECFLNKQLFPGGNHVVAIDQRGNMQFYGVVYGLHVEFESQHKLTKSARAIVIADQSLV